MKNISLAYWAMYRVCECRHPSLWLLFVPFHVPCHLEKEQEKEEEKKSVKKKHEKKFENSHIHKMCDQRDFFSM